MSNDLVDAAWLVADLLARENEALQRLDFSSAVALVPAKEAALARLAALPKGAELSPLLADLPQHLGPLAAENQGLLERAIRVQTRIVRIIARAYIPPPATMRYGAHGERSPAPRSTALALSTRV